MLEVRAAGGEVSKVGSHWRVRVVEGTPCEVQLYARGDGRVTACLCKEGAQEEWVVEVQPGIVFRAADPAPGVWRFSARDGRGNSAEATVELLAGPRFVWGGRLVHGVTWTPAARVLRTGSVRIAQVEWRP